VSQGGTNIVNKTYIMATVSAVGFILNCIFILVITGGRLNSIVFSFVGLIISEIIPTLFMLTTFGLFGEVRKLLENTWWSKSNKSFDVFSATSATDL